MVRMKVAPPIKQESGSRSNAPRPFPTVHIIRFYHRAELADHTQTTQDPIFGLSELQEREDGRRDRESGVRGCKKAGVYSEPKASRSSASQVRASETVKLVRLFIHGGINYTSDRTGLVSRPCARRGPLFRSCCPFRPPLPDDLRGAETDASSGLKGTIARLLRLLSPIPMCLDVLRARSTGSRLSQKNVYRSTIDYSRK